MRLVDKIHKLQRKFSSDQEIKIDLLTVLSDSEHLNKMLIPKCREWFS